MDEDGKTPLHYAIISNFIDLAKFLISVIISKNPDAIKPNFIEDKGELSKYWDEALVKYSNQLPSSKKLNSCLFYFKAVSGSFEDKESIQTNNLSFKD